MAAHSYDAVVIGAGHNGLVTAAYLAKAGRKVLVLERRPILGGIAATEETYPGFKFSACAHLAGSFATQIIEELNLGRHGFDLMAIDPLVFAPSLEDDSLTIPADMTAASAEIGRLSKADANRFPAFCGRLKKLSTFLSTLYDMPLPDRGSSEGFHAAKLLKVGWRFRRLGEKEMYEFLRILPMSLADLLNEWFENEFLKAVLAGTGMLASFVGPRQQGTALNMLHHQIGHSNGALRTRGFVRGGIGGLAEALGRAARQHGAGIRTGAEVERILTRDGAAAGVVLKNGDEIHAGTVISSAAVQRTLLQLLEPAGIDPYFLLQVKNIRSRGTVAKINLALDRLPVFRGTRNHPRELAGVIHIGPTLDYLERAADDAKYGRFSKKPFLEITVPSISDPSLAPAGKHVMSVWMQSAPYRLRRTDWQSERDALADAVIHVIEEYAPGFKETILHRQVLTPADLEETYALPGGHLYHAEMALDQIFFMRPVPGWARYHTPVENLFLCGAGTHPGGGITGLPGCYAARAVLKAGARKPLKVSAAP